MKQQSWQQALTLPQRDDFITFIDKILASDTTLHSISLIDYKNSYRLQVQATTKGETITINNKPISSTVELNNIDHAFSLLPNKTYINITDQPNRTVVYYQHVKVQNHQWVIKIEQQSLTHLLTVSKKNDSLPLQTWIIDNQGQTLINIKQKKIANNSVSFINNEQDFKKSNYALWKKIENYNHQQLFKNNTLYTYSPIFIPTSLKSTLDFKFGNLSPWTLVSKIELTNNNSIFSFQQQSLNVYITYLIILITIIGLLFFLYNFNQQKNEIKKLNDINTTDSLRYRSLVENTDSGIIIIDEYKKITVINSAALAILDLPNNIDNKNLISHITSIDTKSDMVALFKKIDTIEYNQQQKMQLKINQRQLKHIEIIATKINNNGHDNIMLHIIDVTSWVKREQKLKGLSRAVEQSEEAVIITDKFGFIEYVNTSYKKSAGENYTNIIGLNSKTIFKRYTNDKDKIDDIQSKLNQGKTIQRIISQKNSDNNIQYLDNTISPIRDDNGRISNYISTSKDITERINYEHRLDHLAHYDQLTSLPNRNMFINKINDSLVLSKINKSKISILIIEVDLFKKSHDSLDNEKKEKILVIISKRIRSNLREVNLLSRLNNNQFGVIIQSVQQQKNIDHLANRLLNNIHAPISYDGKLISISASIGISLQKGASITAEKIIKNANIALSYSKDQSKNQYCYFNPKMETETTHKLELESELRKSINTDRYEFYYQPKVLANTHTLTGVEALLRWRDKHGDYQAPIDIIPLLESSGLILEAGIFLIEKACHQLKQWQQQGLNISMAINISAQQLLESNLTAILKQAIKKAGCDPAYLELEITESVLMTDIELAYQKLISLKTLGVKIAIDDFGTGYSSLAYLSRFPINILKIDREFVKALPHNKDSITIIEAIIDLAHNLGLTIVAEGVENRQQVIALEALGVEEFQGFYFNKPLTRDDFNRQYLPQQRQISENII
ncbi:EAL domain-containing protein [Photobacterium sp. S4TG1]|uniref:EAL domain-containing protein n=1 Tax=Photobacterium sp. S4TG1 TaxID=3114587 RepID=UPI002E19BF3D|nr:EAL domain-containing protein [Photobacterium sp. S4TG1]